MAEKSGQGKPESLEQKRRIPEKTSSTNFVFLSGLTEMENPPFTRRQINLRHLQPTISSSNQQNAKTASPVPATDQSAEVGAAALKDTLTLRSVA